MPVSPARRPGKAGDVDPGRTKGFGDLGELAGLALEVHDERIHAGTSTPMPTGAAGWSSAAGGPGRTTVTPRSWVGPMARGQVRLAERPPAGLKHDRSPASTRYSLQMWIEARISCHVAARPRARTVGSEPRNDCIRLTTCGNRAKRSTRCRRCATIVGFDRQD